MRNQTEKKTFFSDLLYFLLYLCAVNAMVWLVWFIVNMLASGIVNELNMRSTAEERELIEQVMNILCSLVYCGVFVFVYKANPVERNAYLVSAYENKVPFIKEVAAFICLRLPKNLLCYALFVLPLHIGLHFDPEIGILPSLYIAQFGFYRLIGGVWESYFASLAAFALLSVICVPAVQAYWYGKRLR